MVDYENTQGSGYFPPVEQSEIVPRPEGTFLGGQGSRAAQLNALEGGSFRIHRKSIMNRLIFRVSGVTGSVTLDFAIYQTSNGGSGVATKIASVTGFVANAAGNYEVAFDGGGNVTFEEGIFYLIWCKTAGTGSLQVYVVQAYNLMNQNVQANTHPLAFQTGSAPPAPATLDPLTPTPTTLDVIPVIRFRKV